MRITERNLRCLIRESVTDSDEILAKSIKAISALVGSGLNIARQNPKYQQAKAASAELTDRDYDHEVDEERDQLVAETYLEGLESIMSDPKIKTTALVIVKIVFRILLPERRDAAEEGLVPGREMQFIITHVAEIIARESLSFYSDDPERLSLLLLDRIESLTDPDMPALYVESRKITARGAGRRVLREASAPTVLNVDAYKPVVRKLLISAVKEAQDSLGDEKINEFMSRYTAAGPDRWQIVKELGSAISGTPSKSASALIVVLNSIAIRAGSMMLRALGTEVPDDDRSRPEENINSIVAHLLMTLLDPSEPMDEFTAVDKSACPLLIFSFNWTIFFASGLIKQEVREILNSDPSNSSAQLDSIRSLIQEISVMFKFTDPHSGNSSLDDYGAHWRRVVTRTVDEMIKKSGESR